MAESRPISVRAPREIHERLAAAADRAYCTKSEWVLAAIEVQLDAEEAVAFHVPDVIKDAMPRRTVSGVSMPLGRVSSFGRS